jgi:hypothetical protein
MQNSGCLSNFPLLPLRTWKDEWTQKNGNYILQARGPRSVSAISIEQREGNNLVSKHLVGKESAGRDTLWPSLKVPMDYQRQHLGVSRPEKRFSAAEWKAAFEKQTSFGRRHLFGKYFNNHKPNTLLTSTERPVQRTISEAAPRSSRHYLLSASL